MPKAISHNISVSVEAIYQATYSKPMDREFVHAYRVTIKNLGEDTVQLLFRQWFIWDSTDKIREVKGAGVVGQQPILAPNESHQYVSGCPIKSEMGTMYGFYEMLRLSDNKKLKVIVPKFYLIPPFKYN